MSDPRTPRPDADAGPDRPAPPADISVARSKKRALLEELSQSWTAGAPLRPEDLLARWPDDAQADPDVASLLFEDWRQRRQRGEEIDPSNYEQRFPKQCDSLVSLLHEHNVIHSLGGSCPSGFTLALPSVGDEIFGFQLREEMGRGAFARVFLGEQAQLAGRPVVLKISQTESAEPQTLAQLQHTNIVPIYSLHEDAKAGLRMVCMPYFGGACLTQVLRKLRSDHQQPRDGVQLAGALHAVRHRRPAATDATAAAAGQPAPPVPWECLGYLQAAVWLVARLADALQHAHQRGILHRDIKPSNILLGADGEPMLLDFNLAQKIQDHAKATLGGTVAYMAPEHLRAMAARDPVLGRTVDQRADIYSLGMVLYEMLAGERPFEQSASYSPMPALIEAMAVERSKTTPSIRRQRADVPWSLESILRKCLAPEPAQRYQQAEHLAEDLRAFLDDRPLRHAPELSRVEQVRKWLRRHPRLTSSSAVAAAAAGLLIAAAVALSGLQHHLRATQDELSDADARERQQAYDAGTLRALCLVNTTDTWARREHVRRGIEECERTLALFEVLTRDDWQETAVWRRQANNDRAENTRELLLLLARGRVQNAPGDPAALTDGLTLLDKAETIRGLQPTAALWEDRADYLEQLGRNDEAEAARTRAGELPLVTARDYYLQATALIRREGEQSAQALAALDQAVKLQPRHYWSYMQRGALYAQREEWSLAARDWGICKGLWPELPLAALNLGFVHLQQGRHAEAVAEFSDALARDPEYCTAYIDRGTANLDRQWNAAALEDFDRLLELGNSEARVWAGRGVALERLKRHDEADAAFTQAFAGADSLPAEALARLRWSYGFAVFARLPDQARRAFEAVVTVYPKSPEALYGLGLLEAHQDKLEPALDYFDRALAANPNLVEAHRFRGVLLARRGRITEALVDVNWCLEREPNSGATLYNAACVASLASERGDPAAAQAAIEQAAMLLERAFKAGYGRDKAVTDPDLAGLRRHPVFQRLLSSYP
jgi:eukaryotic-like serine/threonine-protein kinase